MKFAFVTCVQIGLSCIEKIYEIGGKLNLVITLHDHKAKKKSGRIYPDAFCNAHAIPLLKINHINDGGVAAAMKEYEIDWLFIIGWSQIASVELIGSAGKGAIGMHPTLLPEGRGRAAIPWAILKGLHKTGVTMFKMDEGVDTGPILGQYEIPVSDTETSGTLYKKVNTAHEVLIAKIWGDLQNDSITAIAQDESKATYWEGRTPADGLINAQMTDAAVDRLVRATTHPYPGAYFESNGKKITVWEGQLVKPDNDLPYRIINLSDGFYYCTNFSEEDL